MEDWRAERKEHKKIRRNLSLESLVKGPDRLGIYCARTLDEAHYPSLHTEFLEERNFTQVIQKQQKREAGLHQKDQPILLVSQSWLWGIDNGSGGVLVYTDPAYSLSEYAMPDDGESIDINLVQIMMEHIEKFGAPYENSHSGQTFPATLNMFELALVATLSDVRSYITNRVSQEIDIDIERELIDSISDIRNELDMIQAIMQQQEDVLDKFLFDKSKRSTKKCEGYRQSIKEMNEKLQYEGTQSWGQLNGWKDNIRRESDCILKEERHLEAFQDELEQAKMRLAKYTKHILKIDRDAEKIAKTIDDMLNLSRIEASIKEARNSVVIGWAALAFAIVTVIFTPLSFAASLMALPVNRFVDQQYSYSDAEDDTRVYKSGYIAKTFGKLTLDCVIGLS
jgi:hypothetical protein